MPKRVGPKQILGANSFSREVQEFQEWEKISQEEKRIASTLESEFYCLVFDGWKEQIVGNEPVTRK